MIVIMDMASGEVSVEAPRRDPDRPTAAPMAPQALPQLALQEVSRCDTAPVPRWHPFMALSTPAPRAEPTRH